MIDVILGWAMWLGLVIAFAVAWLLADIASNLWQERRREKRAAGKVVGTTTLHADMTALDRACRDFGDAVVRAARRRDETARWQAMRDGFERGER